MSKHTAGPWSIHPKAHLVVIGAAGHLVASCSGYTNNQVCQESLEAEQTANMNLVAAAPDLLAAAERVLAKLDHPTLGVTIYDADSLRAAIAKSRGEA